MKRSKIFAGVIAVICIMLLTVSAYAAETRSSAQISSYQMNVTAGSGTLDIDFDVLGNGTMNKLGCQSIYVYLKDGTSWTYVTRVLEDSPGMSKTNSGYHTKVIYIPRTPEVEYMVVVTIFAENNAGRDARTETFYVP